MQFVGFRTGRFWIWSLGLEFWVLRVHFGDSVSGVQGSGIGF